MIIYKATNLINGKVYIGQTNNLPKRSAKRKYGAIKGGKTTYFDNAIRKWGWDAFIFEEIDRANTNEEIDKKEVYWIDFYDSRNKDKGYNLAKGGKTNRGYRWTTEQKQNASKVQQNSWSEDKRKRHSESQKGEHRSPNTEFKKGLVPWNKGIKASEDERMKNFVEAGRRANNKKVICLENNTVYDSAKEAARILNLPYSVSPVCLGRLESIRGLHFKYVEN